MNEKRTPDNQPASEPESTEHVADHVETRLQRLAIEGLESGDGRILTAEDWQKMRAGLEELVLEGLDANEAEYSANSADLKESLADEEAGRIKPFPEVAEGVRKKHDFSKPS